jgi:peptide chain release factor 1
MDLALHIKRAEARQQELEGELAAFDFKAAGGDARKFQALTREHQRLVRIRDLWNRQREIAKQLADNRALLAAEQDPAFLEIIRGDIGQLEAEAVRAEHDLKAAILPPRPNEDKDVIVEIRPAAGGDEAGLFAGELLRLYTRYAAIKGWKLEVLEMGGSEVGGIKDAVFSLRGDAVYRYMGYESGVHRVQRVPATESQGRIHTSTVTVAILPEAEEVDLEINPAELQIEACRASGAGGQHVNKTDSAIRVTHLPTGLSVFSQQERSQHKNKDIALRLLRSRLLQARQEAEAAKYAAERRQQVGTGDRSERIRTYNFPQSRVTDHRYGITRYDLAQVMSGERFGDLVEEILSKDIEQRLAEELQ